MSDYKRPGAKETITFRVDSEMKRVVERIAVNKKLTVSRICEKLLASGLQVCQYDDTDHGEG